MLFTKKNCTRTAILVFLLSLIVSLLASCVSTPVIHTKEEIISALEGEESEPKRDYSYATDYLRYFGLPSFDAAKVKWVERVFFTYYNYDHGTDLSFDYGEGDVLPIAASVTRYFLDEYYDLIDLSDKDAVTTAIIDSYVRISADPYAIYRLPEASDGFESDMSGTYAGIGVAVEYNHSDETIMVATVYPDSPAEHAGMRVGDFIHAVEGELVSNIGYLNIVSKIRGEAGTSVKITVLRGGVEVDLVATRAKITERSIEYELLGDGIGYIKITTFKDNTDEQFKEAIDALLDEGAVGLVFDLRSNTGGYLDTVVNMLSYLLPTGKPLLSYQYKNEMKHTLLSTIDTSSSGEEFDSVVDLPMAVISNRYTASAAEIFTSVIRDYRNAGELDATIVGDRTYGKGIMQSSVYHGDGSSVTLTVAYYNPPSGVNYQGVGISPDVEDINPETQLYTALTEIKKFTACSESSRKHVFEEYVSNGDASCTRDGTKSAKCAYCPVTDTKVDVGTMLPHEYGEYVSNRDATFTSDGTKSAKCHNCTHVDTVIDIGSHEGKCDLVLSAISDSLAIGEDNLGTVSDYLVLWGFPEFSTAKVKWAESVFKSYYNYRHEGDLSFDYKSGDVLPLAAAVATKFLTEYLEFTDPADSVAVTNALIDAYTDLSGDPYAVYRLPDAYDDFQADMSGKFGGIGIVVEYDHQDETIMVSTVFESSPAGTAGLRVGDYIYSIDGVTVKDAGYLNAVYKIRGEIGTSVSITVLRDGKELSFTIMRAEVVEESVSYEITDDNIGYIKITTFKNNTDEQFKDAVDALRKEGVSGIIFDLRDNTGGYLDTVVNMLSYILPSGKTIVSYQYKNGIKYILKSTDDSYGSGTPTDSVLDLPMAVIVNGYTASAAEIFTSVIRDYRDAGELDALIVGERTFGKGIMQSLFTHSDGSSVAITTAYYNPPSDENYHNEGILPDVEAALSAEGDAQLDTALSEIKKLINGN